MNKVLSRFFKKAAASPVLGIISNLKQESIEIDGPFPFYIKKNVLILNKNWEEKSNEEISDIDALKIEQTLSFACYFYSLGFTKPSKGISLPHIAYLSKYLSCLLLLSADPFLNFTQVKSRDCVGDATLAGTFLEHLKDQGLSIDIDKYYNKIKVEIEEETVVVDISKNMCWDYLYERISSIVNAISLEAKLEQMLLFPNFKDPDSTNWGSCLFIGLGQDEFDEGEEIDRKNSLNTLITGIKGGWGTSSSGVIEKLDLPDNESSFLDFKEILMSNVRSILHTDGDFSWRTKRHGEPSEIALEPSLSGTNFKDLMFIVDTSGSMSREELIDSGTEIQNFIRSDTKTTLIYAQVDTEIQNLEIFKPYDYFEIEDVIPQGFKGRGGTVFNKAFLQLEDLIEDHQMNIDNLVVVVHTDMGFSLPPEPSFGQNIIWVSRHQSEPSYGTFVLVRDSKKKHSLY